MWWKNVKYAYDSWCSDCIGLYNVFISFHFFAFVRNFVGPGCLINQNFELHRVVEYRPSFDR